jgi:hypothetical protein
MLRECLIPARKHVITLGKHKCCQTALCRRRRYHSADNPQTALDRTDGDGGAIRDRVHRTANMEFSKKFWEFWGVKSDIEASGEFIRLYMTRYERWRSPPFLLGESYWTTLPNSSSTS